MRLMPYNWRSSLQLARKCRESRASGRNRMNTRVGFAWPYPYHCMAVIGIRSVIDKNDK